MVQKKGISGNIGKAAIYAIVILLGLICLLPMMNILAISFSSSEAAAANAVGFLPVKFTTAAYEKIIGDGQFWRSFGISVLRVALALVLNMVLIVLMAYPLSKSEREFRGRNIYMGILIFAMLFSGGMMPTYFIVAKTGLIDTIWSLVLPGAVPIFSCIVLLNFFRGVPEELEKSAVLDGANPFQILVRIFLPISKPSIATVTLFSLISHWNSWFDGLIYSNHTENYPMQSYLQTLVVTTASSMENMDVDTMLDRLNVNETNMQSAQIFISIIPLMLVYPFLQKYFTKGLTLGSVKG